MLLGLTRGVMPALFTTSESTCGQSLARDTQVLEAHGDVYCPTSCWFSEQHSMIHDAKYPLVSGQTCLGIP